MTHLQLMSFLARPGRPYLRKKPFEATSISKTVAQQMDIVKELYARMVLKMLLEQNSPYSTCTTLVWMEISSLINLLIAIKKSFDAENIPHANDKIVFKLRWFGFNLGQLNCTSFPFGYGLHMPIRCSL